MDHPDDGKTTVNIKGISVKAWEKARNAAEKQDETMGEWISRAAHQLADREAGPREFPPAAPANPLANLRPETVKPGGLTVPELAGLMQSMAALAAATGTPPAKADIRRAYGLVDDHIREARGMPPRPIRIRLAAPSSMARAIAAGAEGPDFEHAAE